MSTAPYPSAVDSPTPSQALWSRLHRAVDLLKFCLQPAQRLALRRRERRLRLTETVSLGEKRSVSILEVDGSSFLVGCSCASIALLAVLNPEAATRPLEPAAGTVPWPALSTFEEVLHQKAQTEATR